MGEQNREMLLAEMLTWEGEEMELIIERGRVDPGVTFSEEAMEQLHDQMVIFVGSRVMRRWTLTNEPPSVLKVEMRVVVS